MSSRALRKAQKEREQLDLERKQLEAEDAESEDDEHQAAPSSKPSAFEMLSQMQEEGDDADERDEQDDKEIDENVEDENNDGAELADPSGTTQQQASNSKRKKKKKKKQAKGAAQQSRSEATGIDDIDAVLNAASLNDNARDNNTDSAQDEELEVCPHLSIDTHHLHVSNEMRRLFGRAAFDAELEERAENQSQHERPQPGQAVGLADAITGRFSVGGPGLPAILRRRNIFIQGKEEWPRQTSNGLSMEIESHSPNGIVTYKFVHAKQYRTTQNLFTQFVAMMDPNNLVNLLRYNPYHVATLLQVSEIAKHERDNATSGVLLERALFAFGKAVHPSFAANLSKGKARLDFRRPENREFFLAALRYIINIGLRATWRTAYEWTKLLLSLDPSGDHYCVHLVIDKLAIRAKQSQSFFELATTKFFSSRWADLANIRYSLSQAQRMIDGGSTSERSEKLLQEAVQRCPWVAASLFQALGIDKIPPSIWGSSAPTEKDKLHSELYVTLGQDIWKPAESAAFLKNTVAAIQKDATDHPTVSTVDITLDEARFVILQDKPELNALLPKTLSSRLSSMADPLRPPDSIDAYELHRPEDFDLGAALEAAGNGTGETDGLPPGSIAASRPPTTRSQAAELLARSRADFIYELCRIYEFLAGVLPDRYVPDYVEGMPGLPDPPSPDPTFMDIQGEDESLRAFLYVLTQQPSRRVALAEDASEGANVPQVALIEGGLLKIVFPLISDDDEPSSAELKEVLMVVSG